MRRTLGLYGFGSSAHIVAQVAKHQGRKVCAFDTAGRPGRAIVRAQARRGVGRRLDVLPPVALDAAIIFAPSGVLVPRALKAIRAGGSVVCAGIHMSDIPSFPYELLWGERTLRSVANLTRRDGLEFLDLVSQVRLHTEVRAYAFDQANQALDDLRAGRFSGSAVVSIQ